MTVPTPGAGTGGIDQMAFNQSQKDLFEQMASNANAAQPNSPGALGGQVLDHMDGYLSRVGSYQSPAITNTADHPDYTFSSEKAVAPKDSAEVSSKKDDQMNAVIESLGKTFDYSLETTMVVRGATQTSGSANTLLKGQ